MKKSFKWRGLPAPQKDRKNRNGTGERVYDRHIWSRKEFALEVVKCVGITVLFAWFFYRSIWAVIPLSVLGILLWKQDEKKKTAQDKRMLILQFRDCIHCADASIRAGYSVENAFLSALPDMRLLYGENAFICLELERMHRGIVVNITLEELFRDFGERSHAAQIQEFAEVLAIAKRSGGNIPEMIRTSAEMIYRKVEAEEEIYTQTAAKRLEQSIMNAMPFGIVIYLESGSRGYFDMLFHNFQGICIMSGCLALYLTACSLSGRILDKAMAIWEER